MEEIVCLRGHSGSVNVIDISDNGDFIASGSDDGTVRFWSLKERRELACLEGHTSFVHSVCLSQDCTKIASGAFDSAIRIWDVGASREIARIHAVHVVAGIQPMVRFLAKGERAAFVWNDNTVRIWEIPTGKEVACWHVSDAPVAALAVCDKGRHVMVMSSNHRVTIWDGETCTLLKECDGVLLTSGDVLSHLHPRRFRWRLVPLDLGSALVHDKTEQPVAWCPERFLSRVPSARTWVCSAGSYVRLYSLEGSGLPAETVEQRSATGASQNETHVRTKWKPDKLVFRRTP